MDPENPTHRLYKNGEFIPETRLTPEQVEHNKNSKNESFQNGGCFGNGPGRFETHVHIMSISRCYKQLSWTT